MAGSAGGETGGPLKLRQFATCKQGGRKHSQRSLCGVPGDTGPQNGHGGGAGSSSVPCSYPDGGQAEGLIPPQDPGGREKPLNSLLHPGKRLRDGSSLQASKIDPGVWEDHKTFCKPRIQAQLQPRPVGRVDM